jgi:DNA-binding MarR family transcriptional regulator
MTTAAAAREMDGLLRTLHRSLMHQTRVRFDGAALSVARAQLLWVVHRLQPVTMKALREQLYHSKSTVSAGVDKLVRAGLLRRSRLGSDRRLIELRLTESGARRIRAVLQSRQRLLARALRLAPGVPAETLVRMLAEVLRALQAASDGRGRAGGGRPAARFDPPRRRS